MKIKIVDSAFVHATSFGNGDFKINPSFFQWDRTNSSNEFCFFTDSNLEQVANPSLIQCKRNIAWLLEPPSINQNSYQWIMSNFSFFDFVLTHNKELLSIDKRFNWYPHGGWIEPNDMKVYSKSKGISIIASNKNQTTGHSLRHQIIQTFGDKIDLVCGRGYKPFNLKVEALRDFRYSIVVENGQFDTYFTEKIIDCFMTGTVPIYWGCSLKGIFDERGILYFNNFQELDIILNQIRNGQISYTNMIESIQNNFEIAKQFTITEDWIYTNFLKVLV